MSSTPLPRRAARCGRLFARGEPLPLWQHAALTAAAMLALLVITGILGGAL